MVDKLKEIFEELFSIKSEDFNEDLDMSGVIGWDSMNHLNLVISLEQSFKVSFTTDEVIQMISVRNILEILNRKSIRG